MVHHFTKLKKDGKISIFIVMIQRPVHVGNEKYRFKMDFFVLSL